MEETVKLAQFYNASDEERKLKILKRADVTHCIPDSPPGTLKKNRYEGYNYLHFAVEKCSLNLVNILLDQGVDLLQQGTDDGITPLHNAIFHSKYRHFMGKLKKNGIVDTLLSVQVLKRQTFNPRCKEGMTHLHIACIANHTEAVAMFANTKESLDQAISSDKYYFPGYTALHFAVWYSSIESVEILLKNGANIHLKDSKGLSALDLLIQRMLEVKDFMCMGKKALIKPYQREFKELESIAKYFLENRRPDHINFVGDTGLSTFHLACTFADPFIISEFLKENININSSVKNDSQLWRAWTPLHFAACFSVDMFKLMLQYGADISVKNAKGETPLDLCAMRYNPVDIHSILFVNNGIQNMIMSDGVTKMLDFIAAMNDCNSLNNFMQNLKDVNVIIPVSSPIWPGYNALHMVISLNEKTKAQEDFLKKLAFKEDFSSLPQVYNCNEDDENKYWKRIVMCLSKRCSLNAKNANGLSPIHLAFNLRKEKVINYLLNSCQDNTVDSNNLSILHIACAMGRKDVVELLLNRGAKINIQTKSSFEWIGKPVGLMTNNSKPYLVPVRAKSTPLHVAVIFENVNIMDYLLKKGANVYAKDALGLTPIHLLMASSKGNQPATILAKTFLREIPNLKESVSNHGLSHLHVAAYGDDDFSIEQLIRQGASVDAVFDTTAPEIKFDEHPPCELSFLARHAGMTPLGVAVGRDCANAVRLLLINGANMFTQIHTGETLLQRMTDYFSMMMIEHFVKKLKQDKRIVEAIDPCGLTLLHIACAAFDLKWAKKLLEKGANVNAQILQNEDLSWSGDTPLSVLVFQASIPDETPRNFESLVKLLLKYGADVTITKHCPYYSSPLLCAYDTAFSDQDSDDEEDANEERAAIMFNIADRLLKSQKSYDVNPVGSDGFTHFHYACSRNKVRIVKKFLDNGIDVNLRIDPFSLSRMAGYTPLHVAFQHNCEAVARLLIERGADVKAEDRSGCTPLLTALMNGFIDLQMFEIMLSKGADINAQVMCNRRKPIDYLLNLKNFTYNQLVLFLAHGSTINITNTTVGSIMANAKPEDRQAIFKKIMDIFNFNDTVANHGINAIESIVAVHQEGQLTCNYYLDNIQMFMEMGYQLDQQNEKGKTALHEASNCYNLEAIEALLLLGANVNIVDSENEAPLSTDVIGFCDRENEREIRSVEILLAHLWKMKFVGLKVHESCEEAIAMGEQQDEEDKILPDFNLLQRRCERELKMLKEANIGEFLTFKDFLHGSATVMQYPTMSFMQRQSISDFFKCPNNLRRQFPELAGLLTMQYRIALQREKLYVPAKEAVASMLQVQLPDLCSENILSYFQNDQLEEIIEVAQKLTS